MMSLPRRWTDQSNRSNRQLLNPGSFSIRRSQTEATSSEPKLYECMFARYQLSPETLLKWLEDNFPDYKPFDIKVKSSPARKSAGY